MDTTDSHADQRTPARRLVLGLAIVALATFVLTNLGFVWHALLTFFAGVVLGVLLDGLARRIAAWTKMPRWAALVALGVLIVGATVGGAYWIGPAIADNLGGLREQLQSSWSDVRTWLEQRSWGQRLLSEARSVEATSMAKRLGGWLTTGLGWLGTAILVTAFGAYFAAAPGLYLRGVIRLFPPSRREKVDELLATLGHALRSWLVGRFASMAVIGVGTSVGLWIVDVPLAVGLGVIAGLFSFVPNVGPVLAAIPGTMIALSIDPGTAFWALVVYAVVQALENYAITPYIQRRVASVPPALLLGFQLLLGVSAGVLGLLVATPLLVTIMVIVQSAYIRGALDDEVSVIGERDRSSDGLGELSREPAR